jgi:hydroxyethylthiazole kinase
VALARAAQAVVAVTGVVDFVTDGKRAVHVSGGSAFMPKVTAMGCALTCLVGAFTAVSPADPFTATVAALSCFGVAGMRAEHDSAGPGSFSWRFLDELAALEAGAGDEQIRLASP